jgi:hypothetical protein
MKMETFMKKTEVQRVDVYMGIEDKVTARVSISQKDEDGLGCSGDVYVSISKRDAPLSELRKDALRAAGDFLKDAIISVKS